MQVTVQIKAELAQSLNSKQTSTAESKLLSDLLRSMNLELHAMHPGVAQADMSKMFYVKTESDSQANQLVDKLIQLPFVEAAYLKGHDEPPSGF